MDDADFWEKISNQDKTNHACQTLREKSIYICGQVGKHACVAHPCFTLKQNKGYR